MLARVCLWLVVEWFCRDTVKYSECERKRGMKLSSFLGMGMDLEETRNGAAQHRKMNGNHFQGMILLLWGEMKQMLSNQRFGWIVCGCFCDCPPILLMLSWMLSWTLFFVSRLPPIFCVQSGIFRRQTVYGTAKCTAGSVIQGLTRQRQ